MERGHVQDAFSMVALWTCVQMFVSLLCCCLPVYQPLMRGSTFWKRLAWRFSTITFPFGRSSDRKNTVDSAKESPDHRDGPEALSWGQLSWDDLEQPSTSTQELAWIPSCHQDTHSLKSLPTRGLSDAERSGIMVQRDIVIGTLELEVDTSQ